MAAQRLPGGTERLACALALAGVGLLLLVALGRAVWLPEDWFDAYQCRLAGRALAGQAPWAEVPVYRSPLFMAVCGLGEAIGPRAGWVAPALLSVAGYAALVGGCGLLALRLGAPGWVAALLALLAGLDRLAFLYAPFGLPDVAAAGACALALALAARPLGPEERWPGRPLRLGLTIGAAALCRPNAGLVGLGLALAALPFPRPRGGEPLRPALGLRGLVAAGAVAAAVYLLASTLLLAYARGSLLGGLRAHGELLAFQAAQTAENRLRYGAQAGLLFGLRALAVASPALLLVALPGLPAAAREPRPAARAVGAWALLHLAVLELLVGHGEARYALPALPALAGLAALFLTSQAERLGRVAWAPLALTLGLPGAALALGAPYELARLRDPVHRGSFAARVASTAREMAGPEGRFLYTTTWPYGVFPRVLAERGAPYPGDPWHGIFHVGPQPLGYHLRAPVVMLTELGAGLREPAQLRAFVRAARGFRAGDVLLVGEPRVCATWTLAEAPPGPFGVARVIEGPDGLDLEWRWLTPGQPEGTR